MTSFLFWLWLVLGGQKQIIGVSYFALPGFSEAQTTKALRVFDGVEHPALATIWRAFGDNNNNIRRFFDEHKNREHSLELHITNETCRRPPRHCTRFDTVWPHLRATAFNRRAATHPRRLERTFTRRVRRAYEFLEAARNENSTVIVTTGLEDNYDARTGTRIRSVLLKYFNAARVVVNPVRACGASGRHALVELHSGQPDTCRPYVFSNDGRNLCRTVRGRGTEGCLSISGLHSQIRKYGARYNFIWWNTQEIEPGEFVEPRRRNFRIYLKDINLVNLLIKTWE